MYRGQLVWNRSVKNRDSGTGRRLMRVPPRREWAIVDAPDLRIVPQDLWDRVRARRQQRAWTLDSKDAW